MILFKSSILLMVSSPDIEIRCLGFFNPPSWNSLRCRPVYLNESKHDASELNPCGSLVSRNNINGVVQVMKLRRDFLIVSFSMLCLLVVNFNVAMAQQRQRDSLGFLKRAITEAGAPALTTDQETQLTTLITAYREAHPHEADQAFEDAITAYNNAILAGDQAAITAQITAIVNLRTAALATELQDGAKFKSDVLAILKSGGQLDPLKQALGGERLIHLIGALAGGGPGFRGGPGPGGSH